MHEVSYYHGPHIGCQFLSLMHWAHRIEDSDTLDIIRDDYLFGSSNVQIQHIQ